MNDTPVQTALIRSVLHNKRCWIFDMDGTLTHAMHDFDAMRAHLELPEGVPILEAIAALPDTQATATYDALNDMELDMAADAVCQPGSEALLTHLQSQNARLGIVTRNGLEIAMATLKACKLDGFFASEDIISRDCCTPKPHPAGIERLLSQWQASPEQAVMVGDYLFDLEAGDRAGVSTVHMDVTGTFSWPEITDVCVTSLEALLSQLQHDRAPLS